MSEDNCLASARRCLPYSLGTMFGALMGTSTVTSYIESAAGIAEGGRTGMMPLTYSFAQGLAFGFVSYTVIKFLADRHRDNSAVTYVLTILFVLHFVAGLHVRIAEHGRRGGNEREKLIQLAVPVYGQSSRSGQPARAFLS